MKLTYNTMPESIKIIPEGTTKKVYFHENIEESNDRYICDTYSIYVPADVDLSDENIQNLYLLMAKTQEETENRKKSINLLKNQLDSSDYKLLKCMESFMLSDVLPYDFSVLLSDRTLLRDKINAMQDGIDSISLDEVKCRKIVEMSAVSNVKITDGVDYNNEHFRLTMNDQISLTTLGYLAQSGQSVPYHADGKVCRIFLPMKCSALFRRLHNISYTIKHILIF